MVKLPIIEDCQDCGACCRQTPIPPFQPAEEITRGVPPDLLALITQRIEADQQFDLISCVWFDLHSQQCSHYEFRPQACRDFEVASTECRAARRAVGLE